jgi:Flp pilus assembly protein TadG
MRARLAGDEGSSLIELAVVLPVVMLLVLGLIDVCLILFGMGTANFAGRSALRYASMHSNTSYSPATQAQLSNIVKATAAAALPRRPVRGTTSDSACWSRYRSATSST